MKKGKRMNNKCAFTLLVKRFRSNPLTALLRSRLSRFSLPEFHSYGFTLAETLLALTVVGIIAAITVPSLVSKYREKTYKTTWKRAFADFSSVGNQMALEYNVKSLAQVVDIEMEKSGKSKTLATIDLFNKYFDTVVSTGNSWDTGGWNCKVIISKDFTGGKSNIKYLSGADTGYWVLGYFPTACFKLKEYSFAMDTNPITNTISVDVNGAKGPNVVGKDVFVLNMADLRNVKACGEKGFYSNADYACDKNAKYGGPACSLKYLVEK